ncbi:LysR substrate-binding domain-containing protein, partial [Aeromonas taiwanensis]
TMQFRRYLDDAAARQQLSLRVVLETDSLFHLVNGVSHGLGRAVVSAGIAATARRLFQLPCHPLSDTSAGTIAFITRKHSVTPAMKAFLAQAEA